VRHLEQRVAVYRAVQHRERAKATTARAEGKVVSMQTTAVSDKQRASRYTLYRLGK